VATLRRRGDRLQVVGAGLAPLGDLDRAAPNFAAEAGAALRRIVQKNGIPIGFTVVGLSGRGSMVRYLAVPAVRPGS